MVGAGARCAARDDGFLLSEVAVPGPHPHTEGADLVAASLPVWVRRAGPCWIECADRPWLDLAALFRGELVRAREPFLRVHCLPGSVSREIAPDDAKTLASCTERDWVAVAGLDAPAAVARLLAAGVLVGSDDQSEPIADAGMDDWFGPAALYHAASRWQGVTARSDLPRDGEGAAEIAAISAEAFARAAARRGAPPDAHLERGADKSAVALPRPPDTAFDRLAARRETHRLFDPTRPLSQEQVGRLLHRTFAIQAEADMGGGHVAVRKNVPSGGGLHPTEAYVLAANVAGLECGWYHYRAHQHRLAPITMIGPSGARDRIEALTAGQSYFRNAAMLVMLSLRFPRHHWKYPNHAKAYRVMLLDVGHLGQMFALAATEDGLGAFTTAAINEDDAERELGLDGLREGIVAALGCGYPAADGEALRLTHYVSRD